MRKAFLPLLFLSALLYSTAWAAPAEVDTVEFVIQYDDGATIYYSGRPDPLDTCGVWFEPPTESTIRAGQFLFNTNMGGSAQVFIWSLVPDFDPDNYYDTDEAAGDPGPRPIANVIAGPINYTFTGSGAWQEVNFLAYGYTPEQLNVGLDNFFLGYVINEGNEQPYYPSIMGDAADDRPYHSLAFLSTPGGVHPSEPGWWAYGIDWMLRAKVGMYGDPPPVIAGLVDPSDTYGDGPYPINATITDMDETGVPGSGQVTAARLIYSVDGGAEVTLAMTNPSGDLYTSAIPNVAPGQRIVFRVEADDNASHTIIAPSLAGYAFTKRAPSGAKILLVNDSGDAANETLYRNVLDEYGYGYDYWYIDPGSPDDMGYPGWSVMNTFHYNTVIWFNGTAHSGALPLNDANLNDDPVAQYMDNGGSFFLSSSDYLGGAFGGNGWWTEFTAPVGSFMYEYLMVENGWSDAHLYTDTSGTDVSADTIYYGVVGDPISGGYVEPFENHPDPNYNDFVYPRVGAETCFYTPIDEEPAGIRYDGAFKMVFLPWVLEATSETEIAEGILLNVLQYFGEEGNGPEITLLQGSRYGIYGDTPHRAIALVTDTDGLDYVGCKVRWDDGNFTTYPMTQTSGDTFRWIFDPPGTWSTMQYRIMARDVLGNISVGPVYDAWYTGLTYQAGDNFLYCSDQPYEGSYGALNYDSTITIRLDQLSIPYAIWDVDMYGTPDFWTVLNKYTRCFWVGYLDWNLTFPYATADNPFSLFLGSGRSLMFSSEEQMGVWTGWANTQFVPGDFAYDWMGLDSTMNDKNYDRIQTVTGDPFVVTMPAEFDLNSAAFPFGSMADFVCPRFVTPPIPVGFMYGMAPGTTWYAAVHDNQTQNNMVTLGFCLYQMDQTNRFAFIWNTINYFQNNAGFPVGVIDEPIALPRVYELRQNYPNPFNPATQIAFSLPENAKVELSVYNLMGQQVAKLLDRDMPAGNHVAYWSGSQYAAGVYFYKLKTSKFEQTKKMVLVK